MSLALPALRLPSLRLPADPRLLGRALAVAVLLAFAGLIAWAVGPANLVEGVLSEARRSASAFITLLGVVFGAALAASAVALFRGRPGWSIGFAVLPLAGLLVMLVR